MVSSAFRQFSLELLELIAARWHPHKSDKPLRAVVRFRLNRDGAVSFADVRRPSGDQEFDHLALSLIEHDIVFPHLPEGVHEKAIFAFNFDSENPSPDPHGTAVPRKPMKPKKDMELQISITIDESD